MVGRGRAYFCRIGLDLEVDIYTQYIYEKTWQKTTQEDALKIIEEEMPQADAKGTLAYILKEIEKGKTITLGEVALASVL